VSPAHPIGWQHSMCGRWEPQGHHSPANAKPPFTMAATNRYLRPSLLGAIGLAVGDITFFCRYDWKSSVWNI